MKKRLFSLLLVLAMALSLCAAVQAEELRFVYDEDERISAEDEQILEELGTRIYDDTGAAVCAYLAADAPEEDLRAFAERFYSEYIGAENGILLVHCCAGDSHRITYYKTGALLASLSDDDLSEIQQAYNSSETYAAGVYNYMNLVSARLGGVTAIGARSVMPTVPSTVKPPAPSDSVPEPLMEMFAEALANMRPSSDASVETV